MSESILLIKVYIQLNFHVVDSSTRFSIVASTSLCNYYPSISYSIPQHAFIRRENVQSILGSHHSSCLVNLFHSLHHCGYYSIICSDSKNER